MQNRLALLMLVLTGAGMAHAQDTLRCGSKIVRIGMNATEVQKYCGKPSSTEVEEHDVRSGGRVVGKTQLNIWTYNRASTQNSAVLEFDQDKLMSISFARK